MSRSSSYSRGVIGSIGNHTTAPLSIPRRPCPLDRHGRWRSRHGSGRRGVQGHPFLSLNPHRHGDATSQHRITCSQPCITSFLITTAAAATARQSDQSSRRGNFMDGSESCRRRQPLRDRANSTTVPGGDKGDYPDPPEPGEIQECPFWLLRLTSAHFGSLARGESRLR
jgi:hypothetical protein